MNRRRARPLVALALIVASTAAFAGCFAVWLDRQALSDRGWTQTSSQLIANRQIRAAVSSEAARQLFAAARVAETLNSVLPGPIAAQALTVLQGAARRLAESILASGPARTVWETANRQAHRQLLAILDRHARGDAVVSLELTPLLGDLLRTLSSNGYLRALTSGGHPLFALSSRHAGQLTVLRAAQVQKARSAVNSIRGLAVTLPVIAAALFAAAIALARGWRASAIRRVGYCLALVAALVFLARRLIGSALADALVPPSSASVRPAAQVAWTIATSQLRNDAMAVLVAAAAIVVAGVVGGAVSGRRGVS